MESRRQIIATIGPASDDFGMLTNLVKVGVNVCRLNMSWGTHESHQGYIDSIRKISADLKVRVPIIVDLSGPRTSDEDGGHHFSSSTDSIITDKDRSDLKFALENEVEYIAMSFVGEKKDVLELKDLVGNKKTKVIAKIERQKGVDNFDEILEIADTVMIARGDLGNEVPLEKIPFIQFDLIHRAKKTGKSCIVATEMMPSMVESNTPTRSDVTDVAYAVLMGADGLMLSNETAVGKYPLETVSMMEKIILESEKYNLEDKIYIL
jgi:pyruvate kinase